VFLTVKANSLNVNSIEYSADKFSLLKMEKTLKETGISEESM